MNLIYAGGQVFEPFSERFSVKNFSGVSKLTISSVRPEDAGKYFCEDEGFQRLRVSAFLTVLGSCLLYVIMYFNSYSAM